MDTILPVLEKPLNAFVAGILVPLALYALALIRKDLKAAVGFAVQAFLFRIAPLLRRPVAAAISLKEYCRLQLGDDSNRWLLVPSNSADIPLDVDKAFVPLLLEQDGMEDVQYNNDTLLTAGGRLRIIGDPGSGKSSLVKRLFRDACRAGRVSPRNAQLPVLIELRKISVPIGVEDDPGGWLLRTLRNKITEAAAYNMDECFDLYAKGNGLLVLLDGLDEVSTTDYPQFEKAINDLSHHSSQLGTKNIVVLTMRKQYHQEVRRAYSSTLPTVLRVSPLPRVTSMIF